ncbi:hypothetical protein QJS04_geneDACA018561 [Acorus gramineus]|uniref:Uncharacterized protein n=1 Tax=Acorus gramineus TaxID=55184 RepID=A0AAV9BV15_ACOGR|nr:hypothetical protein QJS04_geneDACA018561 [Acorus gramineus]
MYGDNPIIWTLQFRCSLNDVKVKELSTLLVALQVVDLNLEDKVTWKLSPQSGFSMRSLYKKLNKNPTPSIPTTQFECPKWGALSPPFDD